MKQFLTSVLAGALLAIGSTAVVAAPAADPVVGTWKLNVAKSKFSPGPAMKSQTRTYAMSAHGMTLAAQGVSADGKESTVQTTYKMDGKDYPVTGVPDYDSIAAKQVDSNTAEFTFKKAGKVVGTGNRVVSKDGKTLTSSQKVTNAKGETTDNTMVFDRQ
jgi:hypothetical protein